MKNITNILCLIIAVGLAESCKKLIEVESPPTSSTSQEVFTSNPTAAAVLTGIYTNMSMRSLSAGNSINSFMTLYPGLSADELTLHSSVTGNYLPYYTNALTDKSNPSMWSNAYPVIYIINSALGGVQAATTLSAAVKQQLLGEAFFLRAFHYFYLTNLYGEVPLITSTSYKENASAIRVSQARVYEQIVLDLKNAEELLSENYLNADLQTTTNDRVRPTKFAANALLARVYLYLGDNFNAEAYATKVIDNAKFSGRISLSDVFKKNSAEAIWQLQPVNIGWNTEDARFFVITSAGPNNSNPVLLSKQLLDSFEVNDNRKATWTKSIVAGGQNYTFSNKYTSATLNASVTEFQMILRVGEQYLIRAEARAKQEKITGAGGGLADINVIRKRAGLGDISATTSPELLKAIQHERQVELFCEWGHRWLDLKRNKTIDTVMKIAAPLKGVAWYTRKQLYPVPALDRLANPNLGQNLGYE